MSKFALFYLISTITARAEIINDQSPLIIYGKALKEEKPELSIKASEEENIVSFDPGHNSSSLKDYLSRDFNLNSTMLRGLNTGNLLVLLDGIPLNDPGSPTKEFDFNRISINSLAEAELISGNSATQYGHNATGGVLLLKTKKSNLKNPHQTFLDFYLGSQATVKESLTTLHSNDHTKYSAHVDYEKSEGISLANDPTHPNDKDGFHKFNSHFSLDQSINEQTTFALKFHFHRDKEDLDKGGGSGGDDPNYYSRNQEIYSQIKLVHDLSNKLTMETIYNFTDHFRRHYDSLDPYQTFDGTNYSRASINEFKLNLDFQKNAQFSESLNISQNIEEDSIHKLTTQSLFSQETIVANNNSYILSKRIDFFREYKLFWNLKGSIIHKDNFIDRELSFSRSINSPSLNQIYDSLYGNPKLSSEVLTSYEAIFRLHNQNIKNNLTIYYNEITDRLTYQPVTYKNINAGYANTKGIENSFSFQFTSGHNIKWAINLLDSELPRRPKINTTITFEKEFSDEHGASITIQHTGEQKDVDNSGNNVNLHPFTLCHLNLHYKLYKDWQLSIGVTNLFNKEYEYPYGYNTGGRIISSNLHLLF